MKTNRLRFLLSRFHFSSSYRKCFFIFLFNALPIFCFFSFGQSNIREDSIEFCGNYIKSPEDCAAFGNMIRCDNWVLSWSYEPIEEIPRHRKELLAQLKNFKKIKVSIANTSCTGYLSKIGAMYQLLIVDSISGKGTIIFLSLGKAIKSSADLPEAIREILKIESN